MQTRRFSLSKKKKEKEKNMRLERKSEKVVVRLRDLRNQYNYFCNRSNDVAITASCLACTSIDTYRGVKKKRENCLMLVNGRQGITRMQAGNEVLISSLMLSRLAEISR